jgi:hypothetical protein
MAGLESSFPHERGEEVMMFCLAVEHVGEFIIRELLYGVERGSLISGFYTICTIFILNDIKAALRRVRKQAITECNEIFVSQRRG